MKPQRQKPLNRYNKAKHLVMKPEYRPRVERSHKAYHRPSEKRAALEY